MWTFFLVLVCGTHAQSLSTPFSYILHVTSGFTTEKRPSLPVPVLLAYLSFMSTMPSKEEESEM
jgi:hypothetical protein